MSDYEPPKLGQSGNWLTEQGAIVGTERAMRASLATFHRLRVVEQLILHSDDHNAVQLLEKENKARQDNIKQFKLRPDEGDWANREWYIPFDLSPEVVTDGIRWYEQFKAQVEGNFKFVSIGFRALLSDVCRASLDSTWVTERMANMDANQDFSNLIGQMVGDRVYPTNVADEHLGNLSGSKIDEANKKLADWVVGLTDELNKLYLS